MRGVVGTWPGTEVVEVLGLQSRSVTWHHPRWGEKPAGLRLGETMREKEHEGQDCCMEMTLHRTALS